MNNNKMIIDLFTIPHGGDGCPRVRTPHGGDGCPRVRAPHGGDGCPY